jgi:hypothetical protein
MHKFICCPCTIDMNPDLHELLLAFLLKTVHLECTRLLLSCMPGISCTPSCHLFTPRSSRRFYCPCTSHNSLFLIGHAPSCFCLQQKLPANFDTRHIVLGITDEPSFAVWLHITSPTTGTVCRVHPIQS